jgi:predicted GNAT family acetyltransferase
LGEGRGGGWNLEFGIWNLEFMNQETYHVTHNIPANRFEVDLGENKAVLIYMIKAGLFILMHTEVPPAFEGQGIAGRMAKAALDYARENSYKVRSYCSYTTRYLERHAEYSELEG